jgi:PAS domain S-box-containing protein
LHQYKTKLEELVEIRTKDFLRSEKRFKQLIEQMDDWVWQVDAEGNYTYSSPSVHKMLAYNVDEILPMNLFGLVIESEKENARKMFFEHAAGKTPVTGFEKTVQDKDGRLKVLETSATPVINEKNKLVGYFGVDRDVTERKNMEKKIVKTIIETESNERERFAKDLHDGLGTSLSGIRMYLNILQREQLDSKKRLEFLEKTIRLIEEAAASSRQIANNIRPHELNELGLVVGIESLVEKIAGSGDLTINLKTKYYSLAIDKDVELVLFRVVSELINNTIKHANAKNISINLFNSQKLLFLVYSDDGAGFDVDEKLFNQKDGMGLGNIVARIKSLRGKCDIAAVKGSGMDCTIELNIENII